MNKHNLLILTSVLFFISIFINPKVMCIFTIIWILSIALCMSDFTKKEDILSAIDFLDDKAHKCLKEKNYVKSATYKIVFPMVCVGIIFVFLQLLALLTM